MTSSERLHGDARVGELRGHLIKAAHHLLDAARESNPNPTTSTLAAAVALHQAGAYVSTVHVEHCASHCVRLLMADLSKVEIQARRLKSRPWGVVIAPPLDPENLYYTDADTLADALRALLGVSRDQ